MILTCTSDTERKNRYCPPALGNGDLSMLIDYTGGCRPAPYCEGRIDSGLWRAGFRYDSPGFEMVPFGFFEHRIADAGRVLSWKQSLHLTGAFVESLCVYENGANVRSRIYCHLEHNLIVIRKQFSGTDSLSMIFSFGPKRTKTVALSDTKTAYEIDAWSGLRGTISFFSPDPSVKVSRTDSEILLESSAPDTLFFLAFDDEAEAFARSLSEEEIRASHTDAWARFWAESTLPAGELPENVRQAARTSEYHLRISSTKWSIPTGIYPSHWAGRYFAFDEFFPLEGLLASGHRELARKITRFRLSQLDAARKRAYQYFSSKGEGDAIRIVWETLEEPGIEGAPAGFWLEHIFHMANVALGAWHCSGEGEDLEFLNEVWPLIRGCAEFYRVFSVEEKEKGRFVVGKCTDLERLGAARENAFMTTCGVIATFRAAADAAERMQLDPELRTIWRSLAGKLTETLPQNDRAYLPYPGCPDQSIGLFSGIFPYGNLHADDPKQRAAIENFCATEQKFGNMYPIGKSVCTWYAGWKAIVFRRIGEIEKAKAVLSLAADETGCFSEVFEIYETGHHPWFCTGEGILLQAICETWKPEGNLAAR